VPPMAIHTHCPICGHRFRRPLTDAEFRFDFRIHEETSEKHKRFIREKASRASGFPGRFGLYRSGSPQAGQTPSQESNGPLNIRT